MANIKLTDVVRPFDGTSCVIEWLEKFELITKLKKTEDLHIVLPMFLEGNALAVYTELSENQKKDVKDIKGALRNAFSVNPFQAYEQFTKRVWRDEPVDVYMTELRKLARIAGVGSDELLLRAFVTGLPDVVSRELRAMSEIETLALPNVVDRARALMSDPSGISGRPTREAGLLTRPREARAPV